MTPQECLYETTKGRLPPEVTFEEYQKRLVGWEIIPLYEDKELIGTVIRHKNELHVGFIKQGNCIRGYIRKIVGETLDKYGEVITSVRKDNDKGFKFCTRLGFKVIAEPIKGIVIMRLVRCKYV